MLATNHLLLWLQAISITKPDSFCDFFAQLDASIDYLFSDSRSAVLPISEFRTFKDMTRAQIQAFADDFHIEDNPSVCGIPIYETTLKASFKTGNCRIGYNSYGYRVDTHGRQIALSYGTYIFTATFLDCETPVIPTNGGDGYWVIWLVVGIIIGVLITFCGASVFVRCIVWAHEHANRHLFTTREPILFVDEEQPSAPTLLDIAPDYLVDSDLVNASDSDDDMSELHSDDQSLSGVSAESTRRLLPSSLDSDDESLLSA